MSKSKRREILFFLQINIKIQCSVGFEMQQKKRKGSVKKNLREKILAKINYKLNLIPGKVICTLPRKKKS